MSRSVTSPEILPQIEALSRLLGERIGLDFPRRKWETLQRVIEELAVELKLDGPRALLEELLNSPLSAAHLNRLIARLTVGETYFLRDKQVFTALRNHILPALLEQNRGERRLDLWCAASSSGEEPYSVAMLLDEKKRLFDGWQIKFSASDINPEVIARARQGVYSRWSLRATPEEVQRHYFTDLGGNRFLLARQIREMVSFYQLNLAEHEFVMPGLTGRLADIIFCRNVLIYFSAELQARVIKRLVALLQPGGWLLVSPSELGVVDHPELVPVSFPGVIVHRKLAGLQSLSGKPKSVSLGFGLRSAPSSAAEKCATLARGSGILAEKKSGRAPFYRSSVDPGGKRELAAGPVEKAADDSRSDNYLHDLRLQAEAFFRREMYREVVELIPEELTRSHQTGSELARLMAFRARSLANLGELEEAAACAGLAVAADKVNPFLYYLSAIIAQERAVFEEALTFYRQALFLEADFVMAHFSLGSLLLQLQLKGASRHLQRVIELLQGTESDVPVPCGEGLSAGRLLEISRSLALKA
ncbi:MAG: protein-glutamate O-methyltransferase CheR [Deltaproteobacteria bacterium]|nr:protein-glutamate O-methyltransferase CheR [Deltaproteobacteria bacterium]